MINVYTFPILALFGLSTVAFAADQTSSPATPQATQPQVPASVKTTPAKKAPKKKSDSQPESLPADPVVKNEEWKTVTDKIYTHTLTAKDTYVYLRVNTAIGEALILEFPEGIELTSPPTIGDLALLLCETTPNPLLIKIWAMLFPSTPEAQMYGLKSNIQFTLNAGITVIINCVVSPPEQASNRIIFAFPEWLSSRKADQKILFELKNKLQVEYDSKSKELDATVERRAFERITEKYAEYFMCNTYSNRTEERLVFLASDRICRLGDDTVLINFIIKNRRKQYFYVKTVKVFQVNGDSRVPVEDPFVHLPITGLKFDQVLEGAIGIKSKDYSTNYLIEVEEEGGLKRNLKLEVGF